MGAEQYTLICIFGAAGAAARILLYPPKSALRASGILISGVFVALAGTGPIMNLWFKESPEYLWSVALFLGIGGMSVVEAWAAFTEKNKDGLLRLGMRQKLPELPDKKEGEEGEGKSGTV